MLFSKLSAILGLSVYFTLSKATCPMFGGSVSPLFGSNSNEHPDILFDRGAEGSQVLTFLPNEREISNVLLSTSDSIPDSRGLNQMTIGFMQMMSHDVARIKENRTDAGERFVVPILDPSDPFLVGSSVGPNVAPLIKSLGSIVNGSFVPKNRIDSVFNLSPIYGSGLEANVTLDKLRTYSNGELKISNMGVVSVNFTGLGIDALNGFVFPGFMLSDFGFSGGLRSANLNQSLPLTSLSGIPPDLFHDQGDMGNDFADRTFSSGDNRVNANTVLLWFHRLFHLNHNYHARIIQGLYPGMCDEEVFQMARKWNTAEYQNIIREVLKAVFAKRYNKIIGNEYKGYDDSIDVTTTNLFHGVAFKYFHAAIPNWFNGLDECFDPIFQGIESQSRLPNAGQNIGISPLRSLVYIGGYEALARGLLVGPVEKIGLRYQDSIRMFQGGGFNLDQGSFDPSRNRFNQIPPYNVVRNLWFKKKGIPDPTNNHADVYDHPDCTSDPNSSTNDTLACFEVITSDTQAAMKLRSIYGKVKYIDAIIGVLAEDLQDNGHTPTATNIILTHINNVIHGDFYWFQNLDNGLFSECEVNKIEKVTLAKVLRRHFPALKFHDEAFFVPTGEDLTDIIPESC